MKKMYANEWLKIKNIYRLPFIFTFCISILCSFVFYLFLIHHPNESKSWMEQLMKVFETKGVIESDSSNSSTVSFSHFDVFLFVLKNNILAVVVILLLGFFSIVLVPPVIPYLSVVLNFCVLSIVLAFEKLNGNNPLEVLFTSILPHGTTEFFALLFTSVLSGYIGFCVFSFYWNVLKNLMSDNKSEIKTSFVSLLHNIKSTLISFFIIVIPFIIFSAFIEGFITPLFMK